MRKWAIVCGLAAMFAAPASVLAQDQSQTEQSETPTPSQTPTEQTTPAKSKPTHTTPKFEISLGYSHRSYYSTDLTKLGMNGLYGSFEDNLRRWIGIAAEVAATGKNQGLTLLGPLGDTQIYTFLVGPRVYPLGHRKFSPFGEFLYGVGYYRNHVPAFSDFPANTTTSVVRTWQGGGGLDIDLSRHWSVRALQYDVESGGFFPNTNTYTSSSMHHISVGIVYRFGQR